MQTCSNCGASVREGAKFCTSCGTRLNDHASASATSVWQVPESPSDASASQTSSSGASGSLEPASSSTGSTSSKADQTFNWSWGSPSEDAATSSSSSTQAEEEMASTDSSADEASTDADAVKDASEVEALDDQPATTDEESVDSQRADASSDSATLSSWTSQWDDDVDATSPADASASASSGARASVSEPTVEEDEGEEDTVARAERLIGELHKIIPSLARPRPPVARATTTEEADELERAARVGKFDDIRDALLAARDNPRDIDNMMTLSGKVDRLLELFDDRNNLARTAESIATRLRGANDAPGAARDRSTEI